MTLHESLLARLQSIVGPGQVSTTPADLERASHDLFPFPKPPAAAWMVSPATTDEVARLVQIAGLSGSPILARGAGLSYTGGLASTTPALVIDTRRLDAIEIHADDLFVIAGAGTRWEHLTRALAEQGLRTQLAGPVSGAASTVGGAVSQALPGSMEGVIGLEVVLADGTVARTGSWARTGASAFHRQAGPDLSGLFIGDCGAFGVKTAVVLRLARIKPLAFASFAYDDGTTLLEDLVDIQRQGLVSRALALDRGRAAASGRPDAAEALSVAAAVASSAGSAFGALKQVASLVKGRHGLGKASWSLHLTAEGESQSIADARIGLARAVCARAAREIEDTVPRAMAARPFSVRGFLGPEGERWVPVHGIVPLSRAPAALNAIEAHLAAAEPVLQALSIRHSILMSSSGAFVTIEPMFLWPDALDPLHFEHLSPRHRDRFGGREAQPERRAEVLRQRDALRDILQSHDAAHVQVARYYPHAQRLDAGSLRLLERLQDGLDPHHRLNPGVLGLD